MWPNNEQIWFEVRIVRHQPSTNMFDVLYSYHTGPYIETVDLDRRRWHRAFDPQTIIRTNVPNTAGAYIERIVLFTKTTEIGIIVQHMAPRSSFCRSTQCKLFQKQWRYRVTMFDLLTLNIVDLDDTEFVVLH